MTSASVQPAAPAKKHVEYKWVALSNTTLGILMATINASIVIISLPAIFRGVKLNPLEAGNVSYLLWMLMGYLLVSAVLVVSLGRLGDIYGRVRIYNAGFLVFSLASVFLAIDPLTSGSGALWLIGGRVIQGVGGAMLMANSSAIVTDAFPSNQRGFALGINMVAGLSGSFIGLVAGGLLSEVSWRLVFWFSVPFGLLGTVWAYRSLKEIGAKNPARIDWWGNLTFAVGLSALLSGITYGIQPYGGNNMGWTNPWVEVGLIGGVAMLGLFCWIETKVESPMFHLELFKVRAFAAGNSVTFLSSIARGGLQFMLIIWLQGIWLPLHGYSYEDTPLWAGIYLLPLTVGFLVAGPLSGYLSDKFGARLFASGGLFIVALTFGGLLLLPTDFSYGWFAALIALNGLGSGLFAAPNTAAVMNSVPAAQRGAANGMMSTFQNSGMVLSIGIFFSLMIVGLASKLPSSMFAGLTSNGVPAAAAHQIANQPPVGDLFASFLGYNPLGSLLSAAHVTGLTAAQNATLTGKEFFPHLIAQPFKHGLVIVFTLAIVMSLISSVVSLLRGKHFVHDDGVTGTASAGSTSTDESALEAEGDLLLESVDNSQG
jgi:MFS family permease